MVLGRALRSLRSSHLHFLTQVLPGQDASGAATAGPRGRKRKIFFSRGLRKRARGWRKQGPGGKRSQGLFGNLCGSLFV